MAWYTTKTVRRDVLGKGKLVILLSDNRIEVDLIGSSSGDGELRLYRDPKCRRKRRPEFLLESWRVSSTNPQEMLDVIGVCFCALGNDVDVFNAMRTVSDAIFEAVEGSR